MKASLVRGTSEMPTSLDRDGYVSRSLAGLQHACCECVMVVASLC